MGQIEKGKKARIEYIDLAKGLCIILVVLHHMEGKMNVYLPIDTYFRIFRMPLYFLLSGLFFKSYENILGFIKRKTNKLLIPFLFFFLLSDIFIPLGLSIVKTGIGAITTFHWGTFFSFIINETVQNTPIWFLWCLFIMNIFFYCIYLIGQKFKKHEAFVIMFLSLIFGALGYLLSCLHYNIPAFIDSAFSALPFFGIGFILNRYSSILRPNKMDKYLWAEIAIAIFITIICTRGSINYRLNEFQVNPLCLYVGGLSGALGIMFIAKVFNYIPLISYWGRYSIIILVTHHYFVLNIISAIMRKIGVPFNQVTLILSVLITMILYLALIPLIKKILPHFTAQKDLIKI